MSHVSRVISAVFGLLLSIAFAREGVAATPPRPLHTGQIDLIPGPDGTPSYVAFDSAMGRLYSLDNGQVLTITDTASRLVIDRVILGDDFYGGRAMAIHPSTHVVYIVGDQNVLKVYNPVGNSVTAYPLPYHTHYSVALDPGLNRLYVSNYNDHSLSTFDLATNQVTSSVAAGRFPWGTVIDPGTHRIYVASYGDLGQATLIHGGVTAFDGNVAPPAPLGTVLVDGARDIAFSPASGKLFATFIENTSGVAVIDAASLTRTGTVDVSTPQGIVAQPGTSSKAYVLDSAGQVKLVDGLSATVSATIGLEASQLGMSLAVNGSNGEVAVTTSGASGAGIQIISAANVVVGRVATNVRPGPTVIVGTKAYVADLVNPSVLVVDLSSGKTVKNIALEAISGDLAVNPQTGRLYVLLSNSGKIAAIDLSDDHIIYSRPAPVVLNGQATTTTLSHLAVDTTRNLVYVRAGEYVVTVDGSRETPDSANANWPVLTGAVDQVAGGTGEIAYDPQADVIFTTGSGTPTDSSIAVVTVKHPRGGATVATITDPGANRSLLYSGLKLDTSSGLLYVAGHRGSDGARVIKVIETKAGATQYSILQQVPLGGANALDPNDAGPLALNPSSGRAYVLDASPYPYSFSAHLLAVDKTPTAYTVATTAPDVQYTGLAYDPQSKQVLVAGLDGNATNLIGGVLHLYYDGADTVPPVGFVSFPTEGVSVAAINLPEAQLHVNDARSDVETVRVSLHRLGGDGVTEAYWNGTAWVEGSTEVFFDALAPSGAGGDWRALLPTREEGLLRGNYVLHTQATDSSGNVANFSSSFHIITPGAFVFDQASYSIDENAGSISITVQRTGGSDGPASVVFNATDGTAKRFESQRFVGPGYQLFGDYDIAAAPLNSSSSNDASLRVLNFGDGETTKTFVLNITADDFIEGDQTVNLSLSAPSTGAEVGAIANAVLTIVDNEPSPRVSHVTNVDLIPGPDSFGSSAVAVNPTTHRVYVTGGGVYQGSPGALRMINADTGEVLGGVSLGYGPGAYPVAVDRSLNRVYVVEYAATAVRDFRLALRIFDGTTLQQIGYTIASGTALPDRIVLNQTNHRVYIENTQGGGVSVYNGETSQWESPIQPDGQTGYISFGRMVINEPSNRLYVTDDGFARGNLYSIDAATGASTRLPGANHVAAATVSNSTDTAYFATSDDVGNFQLLAIKGATGAVTNIPLTYSVSSMVVDDVSGTLYVASDATKSIHLFSTASNTETGTPIPGAAREMAVLHELGKLYLTGDWMDESNNPRRSPNSIGVLDVASRTSSEIVTGASPGSLATLHSQTGDKTYVADAAAHLIYVIDGATNAVTKRIPTGTVPGTLVVNPLANRVYFTAVENGTSGKKLLLRAVDAATDELIPGALQIGGENNAVAYATVPFVIDPATARMFVFSPHTVDSPSGSTVVQGISVIDGNPAHSAAFGTVIQTVDIGPAFGLLNAAYDSARNRLYGCTQEAGAEVKIRIFDATSLAQQTPISLGQIQFATNINGLAVDPVLGRLYLSEGDSGSKQVIVFDVKAGSATADTVLAHIPVNEQYNNYSYGLWAIAANPASGRVFVTDTGDTGAVAVIEGNTGSLTSTLCEAGNYPNYIAFNSALGNAYVSNQYSATVTVLHDEGPELPALSKPSGLTFSTFQPATAGDAWTFSVTENSLVPSLSVIFQFRPQSGGTWTTLPGTTTRNGKVWFLDTTGVPAGTLIFRAVASAQGYQTAISAESAATIVESAEELTGGKVQFAFTGINVVEGEPVDIIVKRASDSTGPASVRFTIRGTATAGAQKGGDYVLVSPKNYTVTFAPGELEAHIALSTESLRGKEPGETIILDLSSPTGGLVLGARRSCTVTIFDSTPAALGKPGALTVKPGVIVPQTKRELAQAGVRQVARSYTDWTFSSTQKIPKGAAGVKIRVEYSLTPPASGDWQNLTRLEQSKPNSPLWTASTPAIPLADTIWFRTKTEAAGFSTIVGTPVGPFKVIGGAGLRLEATYHTDNNSTAKVVHTNEDITYRFTYRNEGDAPATNVTLTAIVPAFTFYHTATARAGAQLTETRARRGPSEEVVSLTWRLGTLAPGQESFQDLVVTTALPSDFSKTNPAAAFGRVITQHAYFLSAPDQGIKRVYGSPEELNSVIHGPLEVTLDRDKPVVRLGESITYTFTVKNTSSSPLAGVLLTNRVPVGTVVNQVFVDDGSGNSSNTPLPNPGPTSLPAVAPDGDGQRVTWTLGTLPGGATRTLKYTALVLYDLPTFSQDAQGVSHTTEIHNDDYDLTAKQGELTISALTNEAPPVIRSLVSADEPASPPKLGLSKFAIGDPALSNSSYHGNGETRTGQGTVTNVLHGMDYGMLFANSGNSPARNVIVHDVIPKDMVFRGFLKRNGVGLNASQVIFYDGAGKVMSNVTTSDALAKVKSMDLLMGTLGAGERGNYRYTVEATAKPGTEIHSVGGLVPKVKTSSPSQGFYITTSDMLQVTPGTPDDLIARVIADVSFSVDYSKNATVGRPGVLASFDISYTQNGDVAASNSTIELTVPAGAQLDAGSVPQVLLADGSVRAFDSQLNESFSAITASATTLTLKVGTVPAHSKGAVRVYFRVRPDVNVAVQKFIVLQPPAMSGSYGGVARAAVRGTRHAVDASVGKTVTANGQTLDPLPLRALGGPNLLIGRVAPWTVKLERGAQITYTLFFGNSGDLAANAVEVGMQVPFGTKFIAASRGTVTAPGSTIPGANVPDLITLDAMSIRTVDRSAAQARSAGGAGPDKVFWSINQLSGHSAGSVQLTVEVDPTFKDCAVTDHSAYISSGNAPGAAPGRVSTNVRSGNFFAAAWESLGCFLSGVGGTITSGNHDRLDDSVRNLNANSLLIMTGGTDGLPLANGSCVLPLGGGRVLAIGSQIVSGGAGNIISNDGASIISNDGASIVASGAGNLISISGVGSFGSRDCAYLLDHASQIVSGGAGNIVASGAGNLISNDGASLISNDGGSIISSIGSLNAGNIVASGAGNIVASGAGNMLAVGSGLIAPNGAALLGKDGGQLIAPCGGTMISMSAGHLIAPNGGTIVSGGAGN